MDTDKPSSRGEADFVTFLRRFPCVCPSGLDALIGRFSADWKVIAGLDISYPCSHSSDSPYCWIHSWLSPLNKYLRQANVTLAEHAPGYLALSSIDADNVLEVIESDYLLGSFVAIYVVKMHRCVRNLELNSEALVFNYPEALASSIAAAPGLRDISMSPDVGLQIKYNFYSVVAALRQSRRLEYLNLSRFVLDNGSSDELAQFLPNSSIRSLTIMLHKSKRAARKVLSSVNICPSLSKLSIHDPCYLYDEVSIVLATVLAKNKTLNSLAVTGVTCNGADRILEALKTSCLEDLALRGPAIPEGCLSSSDLRHTAARLKSLQLSHRSFCCLSACYLANALIASFCVLEKLDLSYSGVGNLGAMRLAEALLSNNTLKQLNLEGCHITALAVEQFVSSLAQNSTIESVRLGCLPVEENLSFSPVERMVGRLVTSWNSCGIQELARVLRSKTCTITTLELAWTSGVASSYVWDVYEAMCGNKHITDLCVHHSGGQEFDSSLFQFLRTTQSLKRLNVSHEFRGFGHVENFLCALSENNTVTEAEFVKFEAFSNEDVTALEAVLRLHKQLSSLTFVRQDLDESGLRCLADAMMENYTMTKLRFNQFSMCSDDYALILDILNRNLTLLNRAIQFLRTGALHCLDAFRKLGDSAAFAAKYASSENIRLQEVSDIIAAKLDKLGGSPA